MLPKRLLDARRRRKALPRGFGWIDHRLLRDGYLGQCRPEALALYVFLVCAADGQGLSYYSEPRIAAVLALELPALREARRALIGLGLIAYQQPLYQLLSLEGELTASAPVRPMPRGDLGTEPPLPTSGPSLKARVERLLQTGGPPA
jgi:hypothetical protein